MINPLVSAPVTTLRYDVLNLQVAFQRHEDDLKTGDSLPKTKAHTKARSITMEYQKGGENLNDGQSSAEFSEVLTPETNVKSLRLQILFLCFNIDPICLPEMRV